MGLWGPGHEGRASCVTSKALGSLEAFMTLCGERDLGGKEGLLGQPHRCRDWSGRNQLKRMICPENTFKWVTSGKVPKIMYFFKSQSKVLDSKGS